MKTSKKIKVSDELLQQRIKECDTFSHEYLDALTDEQWDRLRKGRAARISELRWEVRRNEQALGIWEVMEEYRAVRLNLIATREKEIRDLYFAIEDKSLRIKAINDLYTYVDALGRYYRSALRLEAWNRFEAAQKRRMSIEWGMLIQDAFYVLVAWGVRLAFVYAIIIFTSGARFGDGIGIWIAVLGVLGAAIMTKRAVHRWIDAMIEEREKLLEFKVSMLRDGLDERTHFVRQDIYAFYLFSEKERQTGEREGELTDERRWNRGD